MKTIPNNSPTNVVALDEADPKAGNAHHLYAIQYGGPNDILKIQFQHGPRGAEGSLTGVFLDDLLAVVEDQLTGFQSGPFACAENGTALTAVQEARRALGLRVVKRVHAGVLGSLNKH